LNKTSKVKGQVGSGKTQLMVRRHGSYPYYLLTRSILLGHLPAQERKSPTGTVSPSSSRGPIQPVIWLRNLIGVVFVEVIFHRSSRLRAPCRIIAHTGRTIDFFVRGSRAACYNARGRFLVHLGSSALVVQAGRAPDRSCRKGPHDERLDAFGMRRLQNLRRPFYRQARVHPHLDEKRYRNVGMAHNPGRDHVCEDLAERWTISAPQSHRREVGLSDKFRKKSPHAIRNAIRSEDAPSRGIY